MWLQTFHLLSFLPNSPQQNNSVEMSELFLSSISLLFIYFYTAFGSETDNNPHLIIIPAPYQQDTEYVSNQANWSHQRFQGENTLGNCWQPTRLWCRALCKTQHVRTLSGAIVHENRPRPSNAAARKGYIRTAARVPSVQN